MEENDFKTINENEINSANIDYSNNYNINALNLNSEVKKEILYLDEIDGNSDFKLDDFISQSKKLAEELIGKKEALEQKYDELYNKNYPTKLSDRAMIFNNLEEFKLSDEIMLQEFEMTFDEYENKIKEIDEQIAVYNSFTHKIQEYKKELPYLKMMDSEEFKQFCIENNNEVEIIQEYGQSSGTSLYEVDRSQMLYSVVDYDIMSNEQGLMFNYLYKTKGKEAAMEYIKAIQEKLNFQSAEIKTKQFFESFTDENGNVDLNQFELYFKGKFDGMGLFLEGINNMLGSGDIITENQFEQMCILKILQENNISAGGYNLGISVGNMTIPIFLSVFTTLSGIPGGCHLGNTLMGLSQAGNKKNEFLLSGHDQLESAIYGLVNGSSEILLGELVGKIPGLNNVSNDTLTEFLKNVFKEGTGEALEVYADGAAKNIIFNEKVNLDELNAEAMKSFFAGAFTSMLLNGLDEGLNRGFTVVSNKFGETNIKSVDDLMNLFEECKSFEISDFESKAIEDFMTA